MSDAGLSPANVALLLGRIGSASAFAEVLLSASFGKLADAIGRKPILLGAPLVTVLARSFVVVHPSLNVLVGARLITTLAVPMYWLAYQASMADVFGRNSTRLAILGSRVQAGMGLGYAISSFVGGALAARDIRLAYAASCTLGCCVIASVSLGLRETLAKERRRPFAWKGTSPLAFTRLFGRGALSAKLNAVVLLQSLTNGMGDLWQVLALASVVLGHATSNAIAFSGVVPMALGAGKSQATSARITNLGEELGIPQGQLAAERNTLNAIIKPLPATHGRPHFQSAFQQPQPALLPPAPVPYCGYAEVPPALERELTETRERVRNLQINMAAYPGDREATGAVLGGGGEALASPSKPFMQSLTSMHQGMSPTEINLAERKRREWLRDLDTQVRAKEGRKAAERAEKEIEDLKEELRYQQMRAKAEEALRASLAAGAKE
ncbi:tetracycline-efflux transporter [Chrysochromulina tobinii]|uniref:Tetracycline-efflux transporter n=1 Tax=Chrysochromulina tobinii TaxID=1460289 RepID=A0A0M0JIF8_9EUKA|nr:tetracycline-efflux transporter [Chrysochromulina tobinii]|eukprot:KOO26364.1 tetracycline-efflux transporter [Chrysochromulina sp. CCMP291]